MTSRSVMWVVMVHHKTSDQYLASGKVSTRSIHGFRRYRILKTLTENFNILSNADADTNVDADTDAVVTAIALPVLSYRRAKKVWKSCLLSPKNVQFYPLPWYAPNFEEIEEVDWVWFWASACVRLLHFAYDQERLEIGSWNLICGTTMKK